MSLLISWGGCESWPTLSECKSERHAGGYCSARFKQIDQRVVVVPDRIRFSIIEIFLIQIYFLDLLLRSRPFFFFSLSLSLHVSFCAMYIFFSNHFRTNNERKFNEKPFSLSFLLSFSLSRFFHLDFSFCLFKLMKIHHTHTERQHQA